MNVFTASSTSSMNGKVLEVFFISAFGKTGNFAWMSSTASNFQFFQLIVILWNREVTWAESGTSVIFVFHQKVLDGNNVALPNHEGATKSSVRPTMLKISWMIHLWPYRMASQTATFPGIRPADDCPELGSISIDILPSLKHLSPLQMAMTQSIIFKCLFQHIMCFCNGFPNF